MEISQQELQLQATQYEERFSELANLREVSKDGHSEA